MTTVAWLTLGASHKPRWLAELWKPTNLSALSWAMPIALSVDGGRDCDTVFLGRPAIQCAGIQRSTDARATAILNSIVALSRGSTPAIRHERAIADLWYGVNDSVALARATSQLRNLGDADTSLCAVKVDLAAALLTRYARNRALIDALEALELSQRSATCASQAEAARWNSVVASAWLGLSLHLRESNDASNRQASSSTMSATPVVHGDHVVVHDDSFPADAPARWIDATREHVWRWLAPRWATAVLASDSSTMSRYRTRLDSIAARSVDTDAHESPAALSKLLDSLGNDRTGFARGLIAWSRLRDALDSSDWTAARQALRDAQREPAFAARRKSWIRYQQSNLEVLNGSKPIARAGLLALIATTRTTEPVVARRAAWTAALALQGDDRHADAATELSDAAQACRIAKEEQCAVGAGAAAGASFLLVGDEARAASALEQALTVSNSATLNARHWSLLTQMRQVALKRGWHHATAVLDREQFLVAERLQRVDLQLLSVKREAESALIDSRVPDAAAAVEVFDKVWQRAPAGIREEYLADLLGLRGELLWLQGDSRAGVLLDSAMSLAKAGGTLVRAINLRWTRVRVAAATGSDSDGVLVELDALLSAIYARRSIGGTVFDDVRLATVARSASTLAARLLIARGELRNALRALSTQRFRGPVIELRNPPVVSVREFGDSIAIWFPTPDSVRFVMVSSTVADVRRLVGQRDSTALTALHRILLQDWYNKSLASADSELLYLDVRGIGAEIPWGALRDPVSGRYLIESRAIEMMTATSARPRRSADQGLYGKSGTTLIIDAASIEGPMRLPGAKREARALQQVWGKQGELVHGDNGLRALFAPPHGTRILHFAGHAFADRDNAERSALLVSTAQGDSLVRARTLSTLRLKDVDLVVLAACEGSASGGSAGGGLESLAGVLHFAGAAQVIGANWEVDDEATTELMLELHRGLRAGKSPARALQEAQWMFIRSSDPTRNAPRVWAAFQLLGS